MARYLAIFVSAVFLIIGAVLLWQGRPEKAEAVPLPPAPQAQDERAPLVRAPEASPKAREEKRFSRSDKDKNGRITAEADAIFGRLFKSGVDFPPSVPE